jgi:23S rRNA (cytidine1920-2'-O)/16S rRNA (cytidine1409-2'-O)-methyltransferase
MRERMRVDRLLVERGLVESRERALRRILAGDVVVDGRRVDKAGTLVRAAAAVALASRSLYVSRGGEKLAAALDRFGVDPAGRVCLDVGASTGGFTDCLLRRGAARVHAVDVGRGQLHPRLRADPRVVVVEQTNARGLAAGMFAERPSLAVADVAFISLETVLPAVFAVLARPAEVVALVKPQFEVGREAVGKGVVRDPEQHRAVLWRLVQGASRHGWPVLGVMASPLRGPKGNREFFLHLGTEGATAGDLDRLIEGAVEMTA